MLQMRNCLLSTVLCAAACLTAYAAGSVREIYNDPPVDIQPGIIAVDNLPDNLTACDYHLRIDIPRKSSDASWAVSLSYADSSFTHISMRRNGRMSGDNLYGIPLDIVLSHFSPDSSLTSRRSMIISSKVIPEIDGWSLTLTKNSPDDSLLCSLGQRSRLATFNLDGRGLKSIISSAGTPLALSRLSLFTDSVVRPVVCPLTSLNGLDSIIAESNNPVVGYWRYLDRDTDPLRLNLGGDYTLATIEAPDGTISIIYISGSKASRWKPLMIKGVMRPTIFLNHYDLVWYDTSGNAISSETSADIIDNAILRLNFTLHDSTVRFQKAIVTKQSGQNR